MQRPQPPSLVCRGGKTAHISVVLDGHAPAARHVGLRLVAKAMKEAAEYVRKLEEYANHLEAKAQQ